MPPNKRQAISLETKLALLAYKAKNPAVTHDQLKEKFGLVSRKTVTDILSKKDKYVAAAKELEGDQLSQRKKLRDSEYPELDRAVKIWFVQMRANNVILTDGLMTQKALRFATALGINTPDKKEFSASDGWLQRFKNRHKIKSYRLHGEAEVATSKQKTLDDLLSGNKGKGRAE